MDRDDLTNTLLEMIQNDRCDERYVDNVYDAVDYINNSKEEAKQGKWTYVRLEDIQNFPIRKGHYDKENGNKHFIYGIETLMEYIESLPKFKIEDQPFTQSNEWHINASVLSNPDIEAMAKRDDFLSDENGEKLNKAFQSLWGED